MKVKMYITIEIDDEEYPVPADGRVGDELEESIQEYFYDIDGANIKNIRTIMEWKMISNQFSWLFALFLLLYIGKKDRR